MKSKIIILGLMSVLLVSCTQYIYEVEYEKCNGSTGSITYTGTDRPNISEGRDYSVPILNLGDPVFTKEKIRNVCEFTYTETEIE